MRFQGKVVLVTGAATGIGYGTCRAFAEEAKQITGETLNVDGGWVSYRPYLS